jgi:hypothetical protein
VKFPQVACWNQIAAIEEFFGLFCPLNLIIRI